MASWYRQAPTCHLASLDENLRLRPRVPQLCPPPLRSRVSPPRCGTEMNWGGGTVETGCGCTPPIHPVPRGPLAPEQSSPSPNWHGPATFPSPRCSLSPLPRTPFPEMPRSRVGPSSPPHADGGGRRHTSAGRGAGRGPAERGGRQRSAPGDPRAHKGPFVAAAGARKEPLSRGGGRFLPTRLRLKVRWGDGGSHGARGSHPSAA